MVVKNVLKHFPFAQVVALYLLFAHDLNESELSEILNA